MKFKILGKLRSKIQRGGRLPIDDHDTGNRDETVRFRILIVGRANAGKTSILKKLCGDAETPIVRDARGRQIRIDLDPTLGRGIHNVEHEITYPNRPAFVFHDSRGFEAGSETEMELLKAFIARKCGITDVSKQIHIIWYCISADDERPLPPAELKFFNIDTGQVPIIAIFTKSDALELKAYSTLRNVDGLSEEEAEVATPAAADDLFQKYYLPRLKEAQKQPVAHVRLRDLHKPQGSIAALVDRTAAAVGDQSAIQQLFILAQEYDLELRTEYGISRVLLKLVKSPEMASTENIVKNSLSWLPHMWDSDPLDTWAPVSFWDDDSPSWLSKIPNEFLSSCVSDLADPTPLMTDFHSVLCLAAGVFMVADRVFWASKRAEVEELDREALMSGLQAALALYRSDDEEAMRGVITESFLPSFPRDKDDAKAIGKQLAKVVQERCNVKRPKQT